MERRKEKRIPLKSDAARLFYGFNFQIKSNGSQFYFIIIISGPSFLSSSFSNVIWAVTNMAHHSGDAW